MKRVIGVGVAGLVVVGMAACGSSSSSSTSATASTSSTAADSGAAGKKIAFIVPALDREVYLDMDKGAKQAAKEHPEVDWNIAAGQTITSADTVISLIQNAITQKADVIVLNTGGNDDQLLPAANQALDAGIKIVTYDQEFPALKGKSAFVGVDSFELGQRAGSWLAKAVPDGGPVGLLHCLRGNPVTDARADGMLKGMSENPKLKLAVTLDARCQDSLGRSVMDDMITSHPDLVGVMSVSDAQTLGASRALLSEHATIPFASLDGTLANVKNLAAGKYPSAEAPYYPIDMGRQAAELAVKVAGGESVAESTFVKGPFPVVDRTNVQEYLAHVQ